MKTSSYRITPHLDPNNPKTYTFIELHGMVGIFEHSPKERTGMFFLDRTMEEEVQKFCMKGRIKE